MLSSAHQTGFSGNLLPEEPLDELFRRLAISRLTVEKVEQAAVVHLESILESFSKGFLSKRPSEFYKGRDPLGRCIRPEDYPDGVNVLENEIGLIIDDDGSITRYTQETD